MNFCKSTVYFNNFLNKKYYILDEKIVIAEYYQKNSYRETQRNFFKRCENKINETFIDFFSKCNFSISQLRIFNVFGFVQHQHWISSQKLRSTVASNIWLN